MNGFLVGWADQSGGIKLEVKALPALHLNPPIGDKYSGVDRMLMFPDFGVSRVITRLLFDEEIVRLQKYNPERYKTLISKMAIPMGYVDQFGNITDLQGKKIAYEEVGDTVYDSHADEKEARDQAGEEFGYPNVLGVFEPNGDVRDVHNRLVGHLEESQRDDPRDGTGQPAALKLIQKYEKQHPWHPAGRKITKSGK